MDHYWTGTQFGNGVHETGAGGQVEGSGANVGDVLLRTLFWVSVYAVLDMHDVPWANPTPIVAAMFQWTSNDHDADETYAGNLSTDWVWWTEVPMVFAGAEPVAEQWNVRYEGHIHGDVQSRRKAVTSSPSTVINWTGFGVVSGQEYDELPFLIIGTERSLWGRAGT